MLSLQRGRPLAMNGGGDLWSLVAATCLTVVSFAAVLLSMPRAYSWAIRDADRDRTPAPERVVLVTVREQPPAVTAPRRGRAMPAFRATSSSVKSALAPPPLDSTPIGAQLVTNPATDPPSRPSPLAPPVGSSRLAPPRAPATPWYVIPEGRAPFGPPRPTTPAERDSITLAMAEAMAELAARRVPTQAERDAAAKEAMLKIRNSGRALLVPPDNTGGLISSSIPLPILSRGPSRAARARTERAFDENRGRLERLRARADSLRRARADPP